MRLSLALIGILYLCHTTAYGQAKPVLPAPKPPAKDTALIDRRIKDEIVRTNLNLYSLGMDLNDIGMKKTALSNLLAYDPTDTVILGKLLEVCFNNKEYLMSFLLSKKYLKDERDNVMLLDFFSKSAEMLTKYGDAVTGYKKLYFLTDEMLYGYLGANIEYELGRYQECRASSDEVINRFGKNPDPRVVVTFVEKDGTQQVVPVIAAVYNLIGLDLIALRDTVGARAAFGSAVEAYPDFIEGHNNLNAFSH